MLLEIPDKIEERCGAEIWHAVEGKYIKGKCDLKRMHTGQHGALLSWDGLEPQQQGVRKDA